MAEYLYGVDIGGTTIKIGFFNRGGIMLDKWEIKTRTEVNGKYIVNDILESLKEYNQKNDYTFADIYGIGVGVPGPVVNGIVNHAVNIGWGIVNLEEDIKSLVGSPKVVIANDANAAAAGEMWVGGAAGYDSSVMFTLGTGVGGGIIHRNQLIEGANGAGGEVGHICVDIHSTNRCACGNKGCLETYSSATGIVRETKKILEESKLDSVLREKEEFTAKDVFDAAKDGDEVAIIAVDKLSLYLGYAMSVTAAVLDPEVFIIGGGVSKAGDILLNSISRFYRRYAFNAVEHTPIKFATLGNDAGMYGAAFLALH